MSGIVERTGLFIEAAILTSVKAGSTFCNQSSTPTDDSIIGEHYDTTIP